MRLPNQSEPVARTTSVARLKNGVTPSGIVCDLCMTACNQLNGIAKQLCQLACQKTVC
jgi:hypothetical protein